MLTCPCPFTKADKITGELMHFPCGKCIFCLRRRSAGWAFRLQNQHNHSDNGYFVTITYNTDNVPITKNGFMSIDKRDIQLFMKRLRKRNVEKIKYFTVGEYGGKTLRPHYHSIMFNLQLEKILTKDSYKLIHRFPEMLDGKTDLYLKDWDKGHITIGHITEASTMYTLKYMMKKGKIPIHKNDDRVPEFQLQSKGLGKDYLTENVKQYHKNDMLNRYHLTKKGGHKIAMPRYYKQKIYTDEERKKIGNHIEKTAVQQELTATQQINAIKYSDIQKENIRLTEHL